jgi:hypothetical protein
VAAAIAAVWLVPDFPCPVPPYPSPPYPPDARLLPEFTGEELSVYDERYMVEFPDIDGPIMEELIMYGFEAYGFV